MMMMMMGQPARVDASFWWMPLSSASALVQAALLRAASMPHGYGWMGRKRGLALWTLFHEKAELRNSALVLNRPQHSQTTRSRAVNKKIFAFPNDAACCVERCSAGRRASILARTRAIIRAASERSAPTAATTRRIHKAAAVGHRPAACSGLPCSHSCTKSTRRARDNVRSHT
jgi:hypothetical protein